MLPSGALRKIVCNRQTLRTVFTSMHVTKIPSRSPMEACRNMSQMQPKEKQESSDNGNPQSNRHRSTEYSDDDEKDRIRKGKLPSHVNYGEEYWHKQRQEWLTPPDGEPPKRRRKKAVPINVAKFEELLRQPDKKQAFPHPVPLGQMIDIMTELWEDEGIFD
eukprot:gb/GECG01015738.1/.p1 GENE.gb/GECG01015738.1/~~gb/GECG01015738.1/.p1  ORF type:complete len:162 (+),score=29.04 gb/GECG01015738.1/:1-486(+)